MKGEIRGYFRRALSYCGLCALPVLGPWKLSERRFGSFLSIVTAIVCMYGICQL